MSRLVFCTCAALFAMLLSVVAADTALADSRVALVIGNSAYQNAQGLSNPVRDAQAMAAMLKNGGFTVVSAHYDVGYLQLKRAVRQFEDSAADADIAVVFYAGHGLEIRGTNYIIPVDAKLASDRDVEDEAVALDRLIASVEQARQLGLVVLDACRDNPFASKMKRPNTAALRGVTPGVSIVEPGSRNTLIAYAAKSGFAVDDSDREHSPFTAALLSHLFEPGLEIRLAFGRVRDDVLKATGNKQEPLLSGSLGGGRISLIPAPEQPTAPDLTGQRNDYNLVEKINTKGAWEAFLAQHPTGFYADLARQQLARLTVPEQPSAAAVAQAQREQVQPSARPEQPQGNRIANERIAKEQAERVQREQQAKVEADRQRAAREQAERERIEKERLAKEQAERAQREQQAKIEAEHQRAAKLEAESGAHEVVERDQALAAGRSQTALHTPPAEPAVAPATPALSGGSLTREIKKELQRVGCYLGLIDDKWPTSDAKEAAQKFVRFARVAVRTTEPSSELLDAIRGKSGHVCPLECGVRQVEMDGRCVIKSCPGGSVLDLYGHCKRPSARRKSGALPGGPSYSRWTALPSGEASVCRSV
jgi:uncharacterized caspase-like protein